MNYTLILSPEAEADIDEAIAYYDTVSAQSGQKFLERLNEVFIRIAAVPTASSIHYQSVRTRALNSFPYTVHYSIISDKIFIARIFNTHQHPFW